jgi:hypothetical protein
LIIQQLTVAAGWCVARAVAAPLDLWQASVLIPPVVLIAAVPISIVRVQGRML